MQEGRCYEDSMIETIVVTVTWCSARTHWQQRGTMRDEPQSVA